MQMKCLKSMPLKDSKELECIRKKCLKDILFHFKEANAGHIGSSLSSLELLVYLYFNLMNKEDKFILSKGHAALSLYVVLAHAGIIDNELLTTFYRNGTLLAAHPPCYRNMNGIHFGTGSLGHGLSLAAGFAFSNKFTHRSYKVYCVLSDGDCNEGSTWEAALFAAHHKLSNLYVIIDRNNLQGFGTSDEILNLEPLAEKWRSFNFDVALAENGNDFSSIDFSFKTLESSNSDKPKCIIARTVKGNGVSFMEDKMEWHYLPMNDDQYTRALNELKLD
jgi:transketolase